MLGAGRVSIEMRAYQLIGNVAAVVAGGCLLSLSLAAANDNRGVFADSLHQSRAALLGAGFFLGALHPDAHGAQRTVFCSRGLAMLPCRRPSWRYPSLSSIGFLPGAEHLSLRPSLGGTLGAIAGLLGASRPSVHLRKTKRQAILLVWHGRRHSDLDHTWKPPSARDSGDSIFDVP